MKLHFQALQLCLRELRIQIGGSGGAEFVPPVVITGVMH